MHEHTANATAILVEISTPAASKIILPMYHGSLHCNWDELNTDVGSNGKNNALEVHMLVSYIRRINIGTY